jgi:hypothetical protein
MLDENGCLYDSIYLQTKKDFFFVLVFMYGSLVAGFFEQYRLLVEKWLSVLTVFPGCIANGLVPHASACYVFVLVPSELGWLIIRETIFLNTIRSVEIV